MVDDLISKMSNEVDMKSKLEVHTSVNDIDKVKTQHHTLMHKDYSHAFITAETLIGHPYAGRLTTTEHQLLVDMTNSRVKPRSILLTFKEHNKENVTTVKQVYNAKHSESKMTRTFRAARKWNVAMVQERRGPPD
ncbi:hypothetical protein VNO78_35033 [Psophocarpus tetragonolobus]|uniref:Uncharacterized protein n=1 Tax=Psophocarpus tetragonolobus TaxID=3891 RepID=A0AAN9NTA1_PSOTE